MELRRHVGTMKNKKTMKTSTPIKQQKDTLETINDSDIHQNSPPVSAINPGQGLEAPDSARKDR